jgi:hypothetical protein
MEYLLVSEQNPEPVAEGAGVVVCYDYKKNNQPGSQKSFVYQLKSSKTVFLK